MSAHEPQSQSAFAWASTPRHGVHPDDANIAIRKNPDGSEEWGSFRESDGAFVPHRLPHERFLSLTKEAGLLASPGYRFLQLHGLIEREIAAAEAEPQAAEQSEPPTLPQWLLNDIGEYGMARTDGVSPLEVQHRWLSLIASIKRYAGEFGRAPLATKQPAQEPASRECDDCVGSGRYSDGLACDCCKGSGRVATAPSAPAAPVVTADAVRDAQRYRWLRGIDHGACAIFQIDSKGAPLPYGILVGGHADAAIDAAMHSTDAREEEK